MLDAPRPATDFRAAGERHLRDADLLFDRSRLANADQLYGYCAECACKAMMVSLGMPVDEHGDPKSQHHRKHIHDLWSEFVSFLDLPNASPFRSEIPEGKPFADWSQRDRYTERGYSSVSGVESHQRAARHLHDLAALIPGRDRDGC